MYRSKCLAWFLFICILSTTKVFPQAIGLVYEASSLNIRNSFYDYAYDRDGLIKNIFLNYDNAIDDHFEWSAKVGYGWNSYSNNYEYEDGWEKSETKTYGVPIETEIKYKHFIQSDSVFEPIVGVGIGYYNYITKYISKSSNSSANETKVATDGFGQYITFGLNIHISKTYCKLHSI